MALGEIMYENNIAFNEVVNVEFNKKPSYCDAICFIGNHC